MNFYLCRQTTGGNPGALDNLDGYRLIDGDGAIVLTASGMSIYRLFGSLGTSADGQRIIMPAINAGEKRWMLMSGDAPQTNTSMPANEWNSTGSTLNFVFDPWGQLEELDEDYAISDFIPVSALTRYNLRFFTIYPWTIAWYNSSKEYLSYAGDESYNGSTWPDYIVKSPENAAYCRINYKTSDINISSFCFRKVNKVIGWYGHSVAAGYPNDATPAERESSSFANRACRSMGFEIYNLAVTGSLLRTATVAGAQSGVDTRSFMVTSNDVNYQKNLISLIGTDREPDAFVLEYDYNDVDADSTDFTTLPSLTSRNLHTFVGAYNTLLQSILDANLKARIGIITWYDAEAFGGNLVKATEAVAKYWGLPCCKMYDGVGLHGTDAGGRTNTIAMMTDGIHPASDASGHVTSIMTAAAINFLSRIL